MGARLQGHLQNSKRVPVEKEQIEPDAAADQQTPAKAVHRTSRGTRDRRRAEATDPANRESIIPLKELDVDPEGDTLQVRPSPPWRSSTQQ